MSDEKHLNLTKKTTPELQELLERQKSLIRNKKLLEQLKDNGESVKRLHDKIEKEIHLRCDLEKVELCLSSLNINSDKNETDVQKDKHVQYVCSKDKCVVDARYRPHRTLKQYKTLQKLPKKHAEITSAYEPELVYKPTQCVPLSESLAIQEEHTRKITDERTRRFLQGLQVYSDTTYDENDEEIVCAED